MEIHYSPFEWMGTGGVGEPARQRVSTEKVAMSKTAETKECGCHGLSFNIGGVTRLKRKVYH